MLFVSVKKTMNKTKRPQDKRKIGEMPLKKVRERVEKRKISKEL